MLTDRSRMETYEVCPRLRFLTYHYGGLGIVPTIAGYELMFGRFYHEALEAIVRASMADDRAIRDFNGQVATIIGKARTELAKWIAQIPEKPSVMFPTEQEYLFEGLLWAWVRVKLPELFRDYEVLSLEQEFLWTMGEIRPGEPLVDMMRLDAILKEKSSESIYYKEYKTTAYGDQRWSMNYEHNAQVMANLAGLEEALGIRPAGILVEGHIKGARRVDTAKSSPFTGLQIQDSPLCYTYDQGSGNYSLEWRARSVRKPVWETGFTPRQWVASFFSEDDCRALFVQLPPISPDPFHVERWRRQKTIQEGKVFMAMEAIAKASEVGDTDAITGYLDAVFPLHEQSCIRYGRKCSHYEICHDRTIAQDPISTGAYIERIPHHAAELALGSGENPEDVPAGEPIAGALPGTRLGGTPPA